MVNDVLLNRELIRNYFADSHHDVIKVQNGEQAVIRCLKFQPALVLMDIRIPIVDGKSALFMLRPITSH